MSLVDWLLDQDKKTNRLLLIFFLFLFIASFSGEWLRWLPTARAIDSILLPEYTATEVTDIGSPHVFRLRSADFIFEPLPSAVMSPNAMPAKKTAVLQSIATKTNRHGPRGEIFASNTEYFLTWIKQVGGFFLVLGTLVLLSNMAVPESHRTIESEGLSFFVRLGTIAWTLYFLLSILSPQTLWIDNGFDQSRFARISHGVSMELPARSSRQLSIILLWPKTIEISDSSGNIVDSARIVPVPHYRSRIMIFNIGSKNAYYVETGQYKSKWAK